MLSEQKPSASNLHMDNVEERDDADDLDDDDLDDEMDDGGRLTAQDLANAYRQGKDDFTEDSDKPSPQPKEERSSAATQEESKAKEGNG